jgi:hypothetical protein
MARHESQAPTLLLLLVGQTLLVKSDSLSVFMGSLCYVLHCCCLGKVLQGCRLFDPECIARSLLQAPL